MGDERSSLYYEGSPLGDEESPLGDEWSSLGDERSSLYYEGSPLGDEWSSLDYSAFPIKQTGVGRLFGVLGMSQVDKLGFVDIKASVFHSRFHKRSY